MAPVLPAADEECLHPHLPALGGEREDVGISHAAGVDRLAALDEGRCAQPVAQNGGGFEIEVDRGLCHLLFDLGLDRARFAGKELLRLAHQFLVSGLVDPPHTWG